MSPARGCVALALILVAGAARGESPRRGSFELAAGNYHPDIDSEAGLAPPKPYETIFGTGRGWMFRAGISRAILRFPGALEVGFRTGYFRASAKALQVNADGTISDLKADADSTAFNIIPTSATLTYRLDWFADNYPIPLAPYVRVALERYNWWVSGPSGGMAKYGATNGWSATAGVALLLDFFDRQMAREFDQETGVNHTYVFVDVTKTQVDDFGSSTSWNLSDPGISWSFGLLFAF